MLTRGNSHEQKKIKIRMFRFLELSWVEILTGNLFVDNANMVVKIIYENSSNDHLIPNCIPTPLARSKQNQKVIEIPYKKIGKVELDENDKKIIYFWIAADPISISCLSEEDTRQLSKFLQLLQENNQINRNGDEDDIQFGQDELNVHFIKECLLNNPMGLSTLLHNNKVLIIIANILLQLCAEITEKKQKENCFSVLKIAFSFFGKQILEILIKDDNYKILLNALSWNPFNNNKINYYQEYIKITNISNELKIKDERILRLYEQNIKIKYLRNVAGWILIEIQTQKILQNIINNNNLIILSLMESSSDIFYHVIQLGNQNPIMFLNVFIEIWDTFKNTPKNNIVYRNDIDQQKIKELFINKIKNNNIHNNAVIAMYMIMKKQKQNYNQKIQTRLYQKWIQGFNPFLSYNWEFSQQWMMIEVTKNITFIRVIYYILVNCHDEGLIQTILQFVKWLVKPSENRMIMNQKFQSYLYKQLISQIWQVMKKSTILIQVYIQFIIKIYKVDNIRTRRVLIQNKVMQYLQNQIKKKAILICIVKLIDTFLQGKNFDIFIYLKNNEMFQELKDQYRRNKFSMNVVNSCFKSMIKKYKSVQNGNIKDYFNQILAIDDTVM